MRITRLFAVIALCFLLAPALRAQTNKDEQTAEQAKAAKAKAEAAQQSALAKDQAAAAAAQATERTNLEREQIEAQAALEHVRADLERARADATASQPSIPVRVELVLTEYDGQKKLGSLLYTVYVMSNGGAQALKTGSKVRMPTTMGGAFQYQDVGTSVRCEVRRDPAGKFVVEAQVNRDMIPKSSADSGPVASGPPPMLLTASESFAMVAADGTPAEGPVLTDPATGHVLKTEVTLTVLK